MLDDVLPSGRMLGDVEPTRVCPQRCRDEGLLCWDVLRYALGLISVSEALSE